jgi:hypothetical protein
VYHWELNDELVVEQFEALPHAAAAALRELLDAAVLVDPLEFQRRPDEPHKGVARRLAFGPHGQGLVTLQVYAPDELLLVHAIQWFG